MGTEKNFPRRLFASCAEKRITRAEFITGFAAWQKWRGVNFDCKGYAKRGAVTVRYRGVAATVKGGRLVWCMGVKPAGKGARRLDMRSAETLFEFKRAVDSALLDEYLWKGGDRCREITP